MNEAQEFDFVMIKPSHYDDAGYPIVWWRTILPSNSLAALNGLARDCAARQVLGPDARINVATSGEYIQHSAPARIMRDLKRRDARAMIRVLDLHSTLFHPILDLAR